MRKGQRWFSATTRIFNSTTVVGLVLTMEGENLYRQSGCVQFLILRGQNNSRPGWLKILEVYEKLSYTVIGIPNLQIPCRWGSLHGRRKPMSYLILDIHVEK